MVKSIVKNPYLFFIATIMFLASCSAHRIKTDNAIKKNFDEYKLDGCFALLDNSGGLVIYNMNLDTTRFSPLSTFEIINSLIGLESGRIIDENMVIKPDTTIGSNNNCSKEMNLVEALRMNCSNYFQQVAKSTGRDTLVSWIDSLGYGNMNISNRMDSFWLDNSLKISPDEQLGLVKRLYFDQLPFQKRSQQIIRDAMNRDENTQYRFSYKTSVERDGISWVLGWIEENRHPYFFVTLVRNLPGNETEKPLTVTKKILKDHGFFEGKK